MGVEWLTPEVGQREMANRVKTLNATRPAGRPTSWKSKLRQCFISASPSREGQQGLHVDEPVRLGWTEMEVVLKDLVCYRGGDVGAFATRVGHHDGDRDFGMIVWRVA